MGTRKVKGLVELVKSQNGKLTIVDYGIPSKVATYVAMGYIVQNSQFSSRKAEAERPR
ncbi:MAG: hypothetical protein Q7J27_08840 [Syntrophales bacterium]|nr:hypothetical protein [Syntrophales bacterium]